MHIASKYRAEVTNALSGNYARGLPPDSALKLRLRIRQSNGEFADEMTNNEHARPFQIVNHQVDYQDSQFSEDGESIDHWIRALYRDSRGVELPGTVNPAVLEKMFRNLLHGLEFRPSTWKRPFKLRANSRTGLSWDLLVRTSWGYCLDHASREKKV